MSREKDCMIPLILVFSAVGSYSCDRGVIMPSVLTFFRDNLQGKRDPFADICFHFVPLLNTRAMNATVL